VDPKQREIETEKLKKLRGERDQKVWKAALERLAEVSKTDENVMPAVIEAVKARATVGEICDVWRNIWGEYRPKEFV
jgi:methylmalonyl-CoA mutase N-terminal domain/subunit